MSLGVEIVIAQRGFVWVGYVDDSDPYMTKIINARCIRIYGTQNLGLEHLTDNGPTKNTVLDATAKCIKIHPLAIVARMECNVNAWKNHIQTPDL